VGISCEAMSDGELELDDVNEPGRRVHEVRFVESFTPSGSVFDAGVKRSLNMSRGEMLQVFLALFLTVVVFSVSQRWLLAGISALLTIGIALTWPRIDPLVARLMHWIRYH
jgi:predicted RND superfamily exporter protein